MRLIDADELKKKLKLWAFNNVTTTSPTFDFVTEFDIDECPTVDVLDKIRDEIKAERDDIASGCVAKYSYDEGYYSGLGWALRIIEKYTK